jgi:hypothetical protein
MKTDISGATPEITRMITRQSYDNLQEIVTIPMS